MTKKSRILHIGCGIGRIEKHICKYVKETHGLDFSGEMIKKARTYLKGCPNVFLHQGDGRHLPAHYKDYFDLIYSFYVFGYHLHHPNAIRSYIRDAYRSLKQGGILLIDIGGNWKKIKKYFEWGKAAGFTRCSFKVSTDKRIVCAEGSFILIACVKYRRVRGSSRRGR